MQRDPSTRVGATDPRVCVEFPVKRDRLALADTEPIIEWRRPATGLRDAARADANLVDLDRERLPGQRPADRDRPDQRVPSVELALSAARIHLVLRRRASRRSGTRTRSSLPARPSGSARARARNARAACAARAGSRAAPLGSENSPNRVDDARDRRHVRVLDLPVRIRDVVAGHAHDRPTQVEDRLLRENGSHLGREPAHARRLLHDDDAARLRRPTRAGRPRRAASACAGRAPRTTPRPRARPQPDRRRAPSRRMRRS